MAEPSETVLFVAGRSLPLKTALPLSAFTENTEAARLSRNSFVLLRRPVAALVGVKKSGGMLLGGPPTLNG